MAAGKAPSFLREVKGRKHHRAVAVRSSGQSRGLHRILAQVLYPELRRDHIVALDNLSTY